jgi:conjugal transfer pilin signal peptidase TrbI
MMSVESAQAEEPGVQRRATPRVRRPWSAGEIIAMTVFLAIIGRLAVPSIVSTIAANWRISTDAQGYYGDCLPWRSFLVDVGRPRTIVPGELVTFNPPAVARQGVSGPDKDVGFVKIVAGVPGDHVTINHAGVWINGRFWGRRFLDSYLADIDMPPIGRQHFVVPPGHYFVLGTSPASYDSRYWGMITSKMITGVARPL